MQLAAKMYFQKSRSSYCYSLGSLKQCSFRESSRIYCLWETLAFLSPRVFVSAELCSNIYARNIQPESFY